jgi:hypothetical protein
MFGGKPVTVSREKNMRFDCVKRLFVYEGFSNYCHMDTKA